VKLTAYLHTVQRLRMSGAVHLLPLYTPSWHGQRTASPFLSPTLYTLEHYSVCKQLTSLFFFLIHGSVHRDSMLIKIQPDATICRYLFTAKSLYMFRVSQHPSSEVLKTVTAASGTATALQRGLIRPRWRAVAVPVL